jgi:RNA polymerase sigma-70 factor (ECF subfamily)
MTLRSRSAPAELTQWLEENYATSLRTARLIVGNAADAEEAVQEAFLRAWRFRASLSAEASVRPWLYRVVVNACVSKLRQEIPHRQRRAADEELEQICASPDLSLDEAAARSELAAHVRHALEALPLHLRVAVVLRYFVGLSEREIAVAVGRRPGTVKSRLHEARRLLAADEGLRAFAPEVTPIDAEALS